MLRRTLPPEPSGGRLKTLSLKLFANLVNTLDVSSAGELKEPLDAIVSKLCLLEPLALFGDWSPPRDATASELTLSSPSASSSEGTAYTAANVTNSTAAYWASANGPSETTLSVSVSGKEPGPVPVTELHIKWETSNGKRLLPGSLRIEARSDGKAVWSPIFTTTPSGDLQRVIMPSTPSTEIRLVMNGFDGSNKKGQHGITQLRVFTSTGAGSHTVAQAGLASLQAWMTTVTSTSTSSEMRETASAGLASLAASSGSLTVLLSLVSSLYPSSTTLTQEGRLADAIRRLAEAIHRTVTDERRTQTVLELSAPAQSSSTPYGEIAGARFDEDQSAVTGGGRVELSEGGMLASSVGGSNSVVFVTPGGFTKGKAAWEFKLEEDTNSQCTCFGAAIKPVKDTNYERSKEMWMYRAYNGYRYTLGACDNASGSGAKVRKGDSIRLELDMDAGTMSVIVNGVDQGVCFSGMGGYEVWPAVQFYSSGRAVRLVKLEGPSIAGSGQAARVRKPVFELTETASFVSSGVVGKAGDLGYLSKRVSVAGKACPQAISLCPPNGTDEDAGAGGKILPYAFVRYAVGKRYDLFTSTVALNDDVTDEQLQSGSPAVFEVVGDGVVLWSSPPLSSVKSKISCEVSVLGVEELELRVKVLDGNNNVHPVWVDPVLAEVEAWVCGGWRNDRLSFTDALTGAVRGKIDPVEPFPPVTEGENVQVIGQWLLKLLGTLAVEYLRGMRVPKAPLESNVSPFDLESPFGVQVCDNTFTLIASLLGPSLRNAGQEDVAIALLRIAQANVTRLLASGITPKDADVSVVSSAGAGGDADQSGLASLQSVLLNIISSPIIQRDVFEAAVTLESAAVPLLYPTVDSRIARLTAAVPTGGVIEFQLDFPSSESCTASDQAVCFETLLLYLQLQCKAVDWPHTVIGRWPAKVVMIVSVPESVGVIECLRTTFKDAFNAVGLQGYSFPKGVVNGAVTDIPIIAEPALKWERRFRVKTDPGCGAIHLYSSTTASFEQVVGAVSEFMPPFVPSYTQ